MGEFCSMEIMAAFQFSSVVGFVKGENRGRKEIQ